MSRQASRSALRPGSYDETKEPRIPQFSEQIAPNMRQIRSMEYKNPLLLPAGAVLVVGTGQSRAQIADKLYENGRKAPRVVLAGLGETVEITAQVWYLKPRDS